MVVATLRALLVLVVAAIVVVLIVTVGLLVAWAIAIMTMG